MREKTVTTVSRSTKSRGVRTTTTTTYSPDVEYGGTAYNVGRNAFTLARLAVIVLLVLAICRTLQGGRNVSFFSFLEWIATAPQIPSDWLQWNFYDFNNLLPSAFSWLAGILNIFSTSWGFIIWFCTTSFNLWSFVIWVVLFFFTK